MHLGNWTRYDLASLLFGFFGSAGGDEDGFVHVANTPAATARDFFRPHAAALNLLWLPVPQAAMRDVGFRVVQDRNPDTSLGRSV